VEYTSELYLGQLEELLSKLGLREQHSSAVVIGHSMGGLISTEFTARNTDWVERVVLFNSAGLPVKITPQK
jgi:pimeloyl-ACP methyl ester carboxylesterase